MANTYTHDGVRITTYQPQPWSTPVYVSGSNCCYDWLTIQAIKDILERIEAKMSDQPQAQPVAPADKRHLALVNYLRLLIKGYGSEMGVSLEDERVAREIFKWEWPDMVDAVFGDDD